MALRELFAKFEFEWDQGTLTKIGMVTQQTEAKVVGLSESINQNAAAVRAAASPMQQYGLVQENGALAASTLMRMHEQLLRTIQSVTAAVTGSTRGTEALAVAEDKAGAAAGHAAAGLDKAKHSAHGLHGVIGQAAAAFGIFGGVFGAVFAGHAIKENIHETLEMAHSTGEMAAQLGISTESMQVFGSFAKRGGVEVETLRGGIQTMTRNLGLFAAMGKSRAAAVLKEMGLGVEDIKDKKPDELFWDFGKAIASIEDPTRKSAFAQRIFGEAGGRLTAVFHGTAEEIDATRESLEETSVAFSEEFAEASKKTLLSLGSMGKQFTRIKVQLISSILPAIQWGAGLLKSFALALANVAQRTNAFQGAFIAGGWMLFLKILARISGGGAGVLRWLGRLWPALLKMGRVLLPWLAWTLILDDVITFLQGGDSALGRFLDKVFGAGSAARVLESIKHGWESIMHAITSAGETLSGWFNSLGVDSGKAIAWLSLIGLIGASGILGITINLIAMIAKIIAGTIAWSAHAIAIWAANAAAQGFWMTLLNVAITLGAIAMAVGAIAALVDQFIKLKNEVGGIANIIKGLGSMLKGKGFFAGVDEGLNDQARAESAARAQAEHGQTPAAIQAPYGILRPASADAPPMLARPAAGGVATVNDNREVTVNVTSPEMLRPEVVGRKVAAAVTKAQPTHNIKATHNALVGAPHG